MSVLSWYSWTGRHPAIVLGSARRSTVESGWTRAAKFSSRIGIAPVPRSFATTWRIFADDRFIAVVTVAREVAAPAYTTFVQAWTTLRAMMSCHAPIWRAIR